MAIGSMIGLGHLAKVIDVDYSLGTVRIEITDTKSETYSGIKTAIVSSSWAGRSGEFAGGYPEVNSIVFVNQLQGGQWVIEGARASGTSLSALAAGRHVIQVKNNIRHIVDPTLGIKFGTANQYTQSNPKLGIQSNVFNFNMSFTEGARKIEGPILRDVNSNATRNIAFSALSSHEYNSSLREIGLDPKTIAGNTTARNPGLVESREIVYEFRNSFGFTNDLEEYKIYDKEQVPSVNKFFARADSRADVLGLSLITPNQLIETIKGTVVDIYGNIVDLNRSIIPIGNTNALSLRNNEGNPSQTFENIRRESRRSLAYHFEINVRKEIKPDLSNINEFVANNKDYARHRSRFSFDVDKEGQFKFNVPASSETGNIALPVRAENYSAISASDNDTDPRQFVKNNDAQDIFLDSFGKGVISLSGSNDTELKGFAAPVDRIKNDTIKLGTVYHDMSKTLEFHNIEAGKNPVPLYPASKLNTIPKVTEIFTSEVIVNGDKANAGGRSGTISLDGQLVLNIGANTVDRQSMWVDMAGGVISNIGRDIRGTSYAGRFDGDVLIQVGGDTISDDSRFIDLDNSYRPAVFDLRIAAGGQMHILRFDSTGLRIYTPGELDFVSEGHMRFKSRKGNVYIDGEGIYNYANERNTGRLVLRKPGKSID